MSHTYLSITLDLTLVTIQIVFGTEKLLHILYALAGAGPGVRTCDCSSREHLCMQLPYVICLLHAGIHVHITRA